MPAFRRYSAVSMGPLMAIYPARFLNYPHHRGFADTANRKASWATARWVSRRAWAQSQT